MSTKYPELTIKFAKRKSLKLTVDLSGRFILYCPKGYSKKLAYEFYEKHREKLSAQQKVREEKLLSALFEIQDGNHTLLYFGKRYPLFFSDVKGLSFDGSCFKFPVGYSLEVCRNTYREFLRRATKAYVLPLVAEVAKRHGFTYGKITVKAVHSRYGSCSAKKNLNFSLVLAACDPAFINMVVCHELAHTVHLNHSPKFHELLDKICPANRSVSTRTYSSIIRAVCG